MGSVLLVTSQTPPPSKSLEKSDKGDPYSGLDGNHVLWKLPGVIVQVAGLVTTPGGSWGDDQVLLKLSGGPCAGNRAGYNIWRKLRW